MTHECRRAASASSGNPRQANLTWGAFSTDPPNRYGIVELIEGPVARPGAIVGWRTGSTWSALSRLPEFETRDGTRQVIEPGQILLDEDTTGGSTPGG